MAPGPLSGGKLGPQAVSEAGLAKLETCPLPPLMLPVAAGLESTVASLAPPGAAVSPDRLLKALARPAIRLEQLLELLRMADPGCGLENKPERGTWLDPPVAGLLLASVASESIVRRGPAFNSVPAAADWLQPGTHPLCAGLGPPPPLDSVASEAAVMRKGWRTELPAGNWPAEPAESGGGGRRCVRRSLAVLTGWPPASPDPSSELVSAASDPALGACRGGKQ